MSARRLSFPAAESAPIHKRDVDLLGAVVVAHSDGTPIIVAPSDPAGVGLAKHNIVLFTSMDLFRASLASGVLAKSGVQGLAPSREAVADLIEFAREHDLGVMVDPLLDGRGKMVCLTLAGAFILRAERGVGVA